MVGILATARTAREACVWSRARTVQKRSPAWWDRRGTGTCSRRNRAARRCRDARALGIFVSVTPAVVGRIGVNQHSRRAVLLGHERFYSAKILPVAHQHDLAAHVDLHLFELLKILRRSVIRINHFGFDVARWRHAVEWHHDARIVLVGIAVDSLACGAMHGYAFGRGHVHADFRRVVHPDAVLDDLSFEAGLAKFLGHVVGRRLVLGSAGHVRRLGQDAQVLFGKFRIGHHHEADFPRHLIR